MRADLKLAIAAVVATTGACGSKPLMPDKLDCSGIPVSTIACAFGPTVNTCRRTIAPAAIAASSGAANRSPRATARA